MRVLEPDAKLAGVVAAQNAAKPHCGHRQLNSCGPQRKREARLQDHETMAAPVISRHVAIAFAR